MSNVYDVFGSPLVVGDRVFLINGRYLKERIIKRIEGRSVGIGVQDRNYTAYTSADRLISEQSLARNVKLRD